MTLRIARKIVREWIRGRDHRRGTFLAACKRIGCSERRIFLLVKESHNDTRYTLP